MPIRKCFIIGLLVFVGLTVQAPSANALYSPRLSQKVAQIRQHVLSSQSVNGSGTVLSTIEFIKDYNQTKREQGKEAAISAEAKQAQKMVRDRSLAFLIQHPFDALMMVFNFNAVRGELISNCLRDDIWQMEALRDLVAQEMIKAYIMYDRFHGDLLLEDYNWILTHLDLLRRFGSTSYATFPVVNQQGESVIVSTNQYFFGRDDNDPNFYTEIFELTNNPTGCPEGEFQQAFREVVNSYNTLATLASGRGSFPSDGSAWGNIWAIAQANARIRARQWIQANQISLTVGGDTGGRPQSLVKGTGGGWSAFVGDLKTQLQVVKGMVGLVTPLFNWENYQGKQPNVNVKCYDQESEIFRDCTENQLAQYELCTGNAEERAQAQAENIRCDRYRVINQRTTVYNLVTDQQEAEAEHEQTLQEAETAFIYHISMDSVTENAIYDFDSILSQMNGNIKSGYEAFGEQGGKAIPSITRKLSAFTENQCRNK